MIHKQNQSLTHILPHASEKAVHQGFVESILVLATIGNLCINSMLQLGPASRNHDLIISSNSWKTVKYSAIMFSHHYYLPYMHSKKISQHLFIFSWSNTHIKNWNSNKCTLDYVSKIIVVEAIIPADKSFGTTLQLTPPCSVCMPTMMLWKYFNLYRCTWSIFMFTEVMSPSLSVGSLSNL